MVRFPSRQAMISFWAARYAMSKPSTGRGRRKGHCRVWLSSGANVEISFAPLVWASIAPLDAGTRRVITDVATSCTIPLGSSSAFTRRCRVRSTRVRETLPLPLCRLCLCSIRGGPSVETSSNLSSAGHYNGHVQRAGQETSETGVRSEKDQSRTRPEA
jgi:hypothetical protein